MTTKQIGPVYKIHIAAKKDPDKYGNYVMADNGTAFGYAVFFEDERDSVLLPWFSADSMPTKEQFIDMCVEDFLFNVDSSNETMTFKKDYFKVSKKCLEITDSIC